MISCGINTSVYADVKFSTDEINKERGVVMAGKRLGKGEQERMQTTFYVVIVNNLRYAQRIPVGLENILLEFKPETLRNYYHD
ncbi:hypothetical protein FBD94_03755 [Pedobacter hiemivivus]|uniref:Uncharacterized protein n=1 Tax=Pedobacter hiemivivus TaxID=2530454 RepID=A0A4U1GMK2_9SPHI|nr:hypothetical protein [Pedobacter hiemivivus]TKC65665.1 hypothetical protein FBD94_03755 [Pedobacter hiemivivus]